MTLSPLVFAALAVTALVLAPYAAADPCPTTIVAWDAYQPIDHLEPAFSITADGKTAAYDLVAGTLAIQGQWGIQGAVWVRTRDRYVVTHVHPGTRIPLVARLEVHGYVEGVGCGGSGCHGYFSAKLGRDGEWVGRTVEATFAPGRMPLDAILEYAPIEVVAGVPFEVEAWLDFHRMAGGAYIGAGTAQLRFNGLPPGADVTSCQGYASSTPARTSTWDGSKSIYR